MAHSIQFQLFAPRINQVTLKGSWANWQEIPMDKGEDGVFRTEVALEDGVYQYKFRVESRNESVADRWVEVNDPYATQIDHHSQNSVVRIKQGERMVDTYVWQHDDQPLPANAELVMYELHIEDFASELDHGEPTSKFAQAIAKLDYLSDLGINAIALMPVNEYSGDHSWGYLVRDYFAPESSYGPPEDLKRLVDECHARGIRVIMDGIYNHSDEAAPLCQIDRDYWYHHDLHHPDEPNDYWGPEFNYDYHDETLNLKPAWQFAEAAVRYWVQAYHLDGIRFDAVRQIANPELIAWLTQTAKQAAGAKPFYNIGEHIPENPDLVTPHGSMDGCWHDSFYFCVLEQLCSDNVDLEKLKGVLDPRQQNYPSGVTKVINYLSNHDHNHLMHDLGERGIFDTAAFQRLKLAAVLLMTAVGVPLIRMGEEFGGYRSLEPNQPNPLQWSLLEHQPNRDLLQFYQRLVELRQQNLALQSAEIEFFSDSSGRPVLVYRRQHETTQVIVIANFSGQEEHYPLPNLLQDHTWSDWSTGQALNTSDRPLQINLEGYTAKILVS